MSFLMSIFNDDEKKTHTNTKKKRLFSVLDFPEKSKKYGKYYGHYPGQAAYKAFNKISTLIKMSNKDKNKFLVFSLIERNTNKIYTYQGTKIKLYKPIVFKTKDNKVIKIKYKSIVTRM